MSSTVSLDQAVRHFADAYAHNNAIGMVQALHDVVRATHKAVSTKLPGLRAAVAQDERTLLLVDVLQDWNDVPARFLQIPSDAFADQSALALVTYYRHIWTRPEWSELEIVTSLTNSLCRPLTGLRASLDFLEREVGSLPQVAPLLAALQTDVAPLYCVRNKLARYVERQGMELSPFYAGCATMPCAQQCMQPTC